MPLYDYRCRSETHKTFEAFASPGEREIDCPICGEGVADRVYLRMAALPGRNKGVFPMFDQQLGCTVESSQHRDRIAKERGLIVMGREEHQRSLNNVHENDPWDSDKVDPDLIEAAEKAFHDVYIEKAPPPPVPDIAKIEADYLDASSGTGAD